MVSLPRPFVFRLNLDDPHPQWQGIAEMWESFYPLAELDAERRGVIAAVEEALPQFIELLVNHRPKSLNGKSLREAMKTEERQPALFNEWVQEPARVFAVLGHAKMDKMLNYWAMRSALDMSGVLHELTSTYLKNRSRITEQASSKKAKKLSACRSYRTTSRLKF
ncbi:hypothetical protein [Candidatus Electronema sp. PJ]|uniref:hypothetical protein n=1 Tax=Candidatus Electronema sp. PJ TaxID=3401572 RepID=UPI003AA9AE5F